MSKLADLVSGVCLLEDKFTKGELRRMRPLINTGVIKRELTPEGRIPLLTIPAGMADRFLDELHKQGAQCLNTKKT